MAISGQQRKRRKHALQFDCAFTRPTLSNNGRWNWRFWCQSEKQWKRDGENKKVKIFFFFFYSNTSDVYTEHAKFSAAPRSALPPLPPPGRAFCNVKSSFYGRHVLRTNTVREYVIVSELFHQNTTRFLRHRENTVELLPAVVLHRK